MYRSLMLFILGLSLHSTAIAGSIHSSTPKVRSVDAFVHLDPEKYPQQINEALGVLRKLKAELVSSGYQVETLRLTTQPLADLVRDLYEKDALSYIAKLDRLCSQEGFIINIGPAMLHDDDDPKTILLLQKVLSALPNVYASALIADEDGIHWKTIRYTAEMLRYVSQHSPQSRGGFNFTASAMLKPFSPFFPGSYHTGTGKQITIGLEAANIVNDVFTQDQGNSGAAISDLTAALTKHAELTSNVARRVATQFGWTYLGIDTTPAPLGDISIGKAIENFTGARFGSSGTLSVARIITTAVKAVPQKQVGYSGLMLPIMEDRLLAERWSESAYSIDSLLAYSAVCGTGLDTVPLPGDTGLEQIERIYSDVASVATKWNKPLSARLVLILDGKPGDQTSFQIPFIYNTRIRPLP